VDLDIGVVAIGLAREQRLEPALLRGRGECRDRRLGLCDARGIFLRLAELEQSLRVVELARQPLDRRDAALELRLLAQGRLRLGLVGPERRVGGSGVQLVAALERVLPVKDASSAAPATA
jgi:hypothetical protein